MLLGLIGAHIQASRTPAMHEEEARHHGIHCKYQLIDLDRLTNPQLPELLRAAELTGFTGLNITHPCKQAVIAHLDDLSPDARALGAVNTVLFHNGRRTGHNTDWLGFRASFQQSLPHAPRNHIVQLGAGGAGAATAYAALQMGVQKVTIVDTDAAKAHALAERLNDPRAQAGHLTAIHEADGLIHATPTGMTSHPGLPLDEALLRPEIWVAEIVYFPLETELLRAAKRKGCQTDDGAGMAVHQAVEAFRLFANRDPDPARMHRHFLSLGNH